MNESFVGQKLSKSASGLRMIPVSDSFASPFALAEPKWVADNEVRLISLGLKLCLAYWYYYNSKIKCLTHVFFLRRKLAHFLANIYFTHLPIKHVTRYYYYGFCYSY